MIPARRNWATEVWWNGGEYRNRTGVHGFAIRPSIQGNQGPTVSKEAPTNRELSAKVSTAELTGTKENPGATAIATGAWGVFEVGKPHRNSTIGTTVIATNFGVEVAA